MSEAERVALTEDAVKELQELREMKKYAIHNVPIAAFHDNHAAIAHLEDEVSNARAFWSAPTLIFYLA